MADNKLLEEIETFDVNDLELGEAADLEDVLGCSIDEINYGSAKGMVAILWIMRRRDNPEYTLEDARKIKLAEFEPNGNAPTRPTKAASKGGKKRASSGSRS